MDQRFKDPGVFFEDGPTRLFPNGTVVYENGTSSDSVVFWGAMDPRNPRSITSLKTYLSNTISVDDEVDLDFMNRLDNKRLARKNREGKKTENRKQSETTFDDVVKTSEDQTKVTDFVEISSDYLSELAVKIRDTMENLIGSGFILECSESIACKAKAFLPKLPSSSLLPDSNRCEQVKKSNNLSCI